MEGSANKVQDLGVLGSGSSRVNTCLSSYYNTDYTGLLANCLYVSESYGSLRCTAGAGLSRHSLSNTTWGTLDRRTVWGPHRYT